MSDIWSEDFFDIRVAVHGDTRYMVSRETGGAEVYTNSAEMTNAQCAEVYIEHRGAFNLLRIEMTKEIEYEILMMSI